MTMQVFLLSAIAILSTMCGCEFFHADSNRAGNELIRAVRSRDAENVLALVRGGTDINEMGDEGMTAIQAAIHAGEQEIYETLLVNGADPNLCDNKGLCAMSLASGMEDPFWLVTALKHGGDPNAANIGSRYFAGRTPIFFAVDQGRVQNVEILVKAGANVNQKDSENITPLGKAAGIGDYEICMVLLENGANTLDRIGGKGATFVEWVGERDETMIPDFRQAPAFHRVRDWLISRGYLKK